MMNTYWRVFFVLVFSFVLIVNLSAQTNLLPNGDFETMEPNFWTKLNDGLGGSQVSWATDEAAPLPWGVNPPTFYSLKVMKPGVTTAQVGWVSDNNADLYWNNGGGGDLYNLNFTAKTENVNTSPATQDAKIGVWYKFYDSGALLGEQFVEVDQTVASMDWTTYTGGLVVSTEPDCVIAVLVMEKDAAGTVWFENIDCNTNSGWTMGIFNGDAETPAGWMYWSSSDAINLCALVEDPNAHSGTHSVLLYEKDDSDDEFVYYSEPVPVTEGNWYKVGVWVKTDSVNTDSMYVPTNVIVGGDRDNYRISLCFFFHGPPLYTAWSDMGDQFLYIDQRDTTGWTHYIGIVQADVGAVGMSVRARFTSYPTGYAWFDDFTIEELDLNPNILTNGDFETMEPNFWTKLNDGLGGSQVSWATDEAAPLPWGVNPPTFYSLKVMKPGVTTAQVGWVSDNNADLYWNNGGGGDLYNLNFTAKTENVNTSPATQDAKIGVWYKFYDSGALLGEQFVEVDQTVASMDWTTYTGGLVVSTEPDCVIAVLVMEKDAAGTVWFENIDCNTNSGWTMGIFNGDAETPAGWMYWSSSDAINLCALVEDPNAHSGTHSVLLYEKDDSDDEFVYYSEPVPVTEGNWYKVGVWVKTDSVNTDSMYVPTNVIVGGDRDNYRISLCFFFHGPPLYTAWSDMGDQFLYIDQRDTTGWTHYIGIVQADVGAVGMSVRARFTSYPTGYAWFDDFTIEEADLVITSIEDDPVARTQIGNDFNLANNYPNPFNPVTIIEYKVPKRGNVSLHIYNMLGQKIRTLVDNIQNVGTYQVLWDGRDFNGKLVATGVYLYQLQGENALITKKMTFIK